MNNPDFKKLSRQQLIKFFAHERQEWLSAGIGEAEIFRVHFGEEKESGKGGDYRVWLDERKQIRPDHKYAPGKTVAIDAIDPDNDWISGGRSELDDAEFNIDLETALAKLTKLQRLCFVEVVLNGRTQQSIADLLRVKQQAVDKQIKFARKKLKIFFGDRL